MEGLSAAASSIAVVSIAVQLAESVKKLCNFWNSIKEAPEDIRAISMDLGLLSSVLTRIAFETQHVEPEANLVDALNGCWVKVKKLTTLLNEIEPGFASTSSRVRKWTAFKAVLKHGQLMKFQETLERLKCTLLLVQQNQYSHLSRNRHISLERRLDTITQSVSSLSMQQYSEIAGRVPSTVSDVHSSRAAFRTEEWDATKFCAGSLQNIQSDHANSDGSWRKQAWVKCTLREEKSVMEYFLGTIRAESKTKLQTSRETDGLNPYCEQDQYEHETSYTISPATWLVRLGIHYGFRLRCLSSSTQGWKHTLETICPVPDDALIFEFCKEGNVPAVRRLLSGGHASVRDTDSRGYTPLHFAAQNHHSELCKILKSAGADISTPTHNAQTAVVLAVDESYNTTYALLSEVFDTLRLLTDSMDFSDENGNGWNVLEILCHSSGELHGESKAKITLLLWMLKLSSFELKTHVNRRRFAYMLGWTLYPHPGLEEASDLLLNLGGAEIIDVAHYGTDGYPVLHEFVLNADKRGMSTALSKGPDLHRLGFDYCYTPCEETPTSLAMYSSWAFTDWLCELVSIEVDLEKFIEEELERNHVVHAGWEKETLLDLFAYGYRPDLNFREVQNCSDCTKDARGVNVQPYWRHLLERIKQRLDPDTPAQDDPEAREKENADLRSIAEAASSSSNLAHKPDVAGDVPLVDLSELPSESESESELESEPKSEEGTHGYPATTPIRSDCVYARHEVICMDCWLHYRETGTRRPPHPGKRRFSIYADYSDSSFDEYSSSRDESSENEYSPYLIHS